MVHSIIFRSTIALLVGNFAMSTLVDFFEGASSEYHHHGCCPYSRPVSLVGLADDLEGFVEVGVDLQVVGVDQFDEHEAEFDLCNVYDAVL